MNLNAVNIGMNKYCGPAVLSILTGKSTDDCAYAISAVTGKYRVEGVSTEHLIKAANRLGFDCRAIDPARTLYGTLVKLAVEDGVYIVSLSDHFVAVEVKDRTIYLCDNHTKEPMPAGSSARLLQKVAAVHKVFKRRVPVLLKKVFSVIKSKHCSGYIEVDIVQRHEYDMEEHNKVVPVAHLKFFSEDEWNEFTDEVMKGE